MLAQHTRPRLIPVIDVMGGRVVRGAGGDRANYRPLNCPLTGSTNPADVASTLLQRANARELYIADLDAITGGRTVSVASRAILDACAVPVWLDAGIGRTDVRGWPANKNLCPVVGFETCPVPEVLLEAMREPLRRPVAFSLDLKGGCLLGNWRAWGLDGDRDALALARRVVAVRPGAPVRRRELRVSRPADRARDRHRRVDRRLRGLRTRNRRMRTGDKS